MKFKILVRALLIFAFNIVGMESDPYGINLETLCEIGDGISRDVKKISYNFNSANFTGNSKFVIQLQMIEGAQIADYAKGLESHLEVIDFSRDKASSRDIPFFRVVIRKALPLGDNKIMCLFGERHIASVDISSSAKIDVISEVDMTMHRSFQLSDCGKYIILAQDWEDYTRNHPNIPIEEIFSVSNNDWIYKIINIEAKRVEKNLQGESFLEIKISPNKRFLATVAPKGEEFSVFEFENCKCDKLLFKFSLKESDHPLGNRHLLFFNQEESLLAVTGVGKISILDLNSLEKLKTINLNNNENRDKDCRFEVGGFLNDRIFIFTYGKNLGFLDALTGTIIKEVGFGEFIDRSILSPDKTKLAIFFTHRKKILMEINEGDCEKYIEIAKKKNQEGWRTVYKVEIYKLEIGKKS